MDLNYRIEIICKKTAWSRAELGRRIGCSRQMTYNVKKGKEFGRQKMAAFEHIENTVLKKTDPQIATVAEEPACYHADCTAQCPSCKIKDQQIAELNAQLNKAQEIALALAKAN